MNAVNLIPADSRKRRMAPSTSLPTLALIGALLVVLAGVVMYVTAANKVKSRQAELAQVTASAASWSRVAGSYQSFMRAAQQRSQELADIRQLAIGRYPWEHLLSQIGGLMPTTSALTALQATTSGGTSSSTPGATSSATSGSASSTASGSTSTGAPSSGSSTVAPAGAVTPPLPAVQLSGCAASQSSVAQTMVQLHRIQGVTAVTLASATDSSTSGSTPTTGSSSSGQTGSGGCPFPVQFQMSLTFAAPAATASTATAGAGSGTSSSSTPTAPSTTGSGSTPTASVGTTSTGVRAQ